MPQVTMPQLGEGVEEGTIGKWLKAAGTTSTSTMRSSRWSPTR